MHRIIYVFKHFKKYACILGIILIASICLGNYYYIISKTDLTLLAELTQDFHTKLSTQTTTPEGWENVHEHECETLDNNFIIRQGETIWDRTVIVKTADTCVAKTQKITHSRYDILFIIGSCSIIFLLMVLIYHVLSMYILSQFWKQFMRINQYIESPECINSEKIRYIQSCTKHVNYVRTIPHFSVHFKSEFAPILYSIQEHTRILLTQKKVLENYTRELQKFINSIQ